ncbi:hypothetical protein [Actinoplanes utahensis]|uniref:Uncharacterized protein n=1 Tax=Actinoplanes utahensis TaxID=1869 RepID=A0A0A6URF6_ACTUT|nr:hypothetical protein [Actinoplanes utahensis]KHD78016.1 hypothetical protein MB27_07890 [Actinoplanes utahensis]GIF30016.1 hypothetical protein Aut01nite_30020 [Actinoplanes utahensis]
MPEQHDQHLRDQVAKLERIVLRVEEGVGDVGVRVEGVSRRAEEVNDRLQALTRAFEDYVLVAARTANVQRAETRIGVVEGRLNSEFGHYKVVRNVATGMLQGFDTGIVSDDTMRDVGEELMIKTPRYWLAPVLVGLRAWIADEPEICDQALGVAFQRSPDKTSLFMALVLRRQGRGEASLRWLRHYLIALDPLELGREFAMVLESISQGAFGPAGVAMVQERLDEWRSQLLRDESREQAQIDRWRAELERHVGSSSADRFPRLAAISPQWPQMDEALARAAAHGSLIDAYATMAGEVHVPPARVEDHVDDILDQLVRGYDDEELPLRREHAEHQAVVDNGGDLDAARHALDTDLLALDRTHDYLTIQSESALNPGKLGVSRATQRMAVSSCHAWFDRAHALYTRDYRGGVPGDVRAVFDQTHTLAGAVFRLPSWTGSFATPMDELERDLAAHWRRAAQPFLASFDFPWTRRLILPVAVTAGLALCAFQHLGFLLAAVIVGGVWALVLWSQSQTAEQRREAARKQLQSAEQDSLRQLRGAGAEVVDWSTAFRQADQREQEVRAVIADLATAGVPTAAHERRRTETGTPDRSYT